MNPPEQEMHIKDDEDNLEDQQQQMEMEMQEQMQSNPYYFLNMLNQMATDGMPTSED
jgi:hypothetical protein